MSIDINQYKEKNVTRAISTGLILTKASHFCYLVHVYAEVVFVYMHFCQSDNKNRQKQIMRSHHMLRVS